MDENNLEEIAKEGILVRSNVVHGDKVKDTETRIYIPKNSNQIRFEQVFYVGEKQIPKKKVRIVAQLDDSVANYEVDSGGKKKDRNERMDLFLKASLDDILKVLEQYKQKLMKIEDSNLSVYDIVDTETIASERAELCRSFIRSNGSNYSARLLTLEDTEDTLGVAFREKIQDKEYTGECLVEPSDKQIVRKLAGAEEVRDVADANFYTSLGITIRHVDEQVGKYITLIETFKRNLSENYNGQDFKTVAMPDSVGPIKSLDETQLDPSVTMPGSPVNIHPDRTRLDLNRTQLDPSETKVFLGGDSPSYKKPNK